MGWNFRKSVNLGGGLRLNFSKGGIGISGGIKGLRISKGPRGTRLHASIPGTGLYYTKTLSDNRYQYKETVSNAYTGETRELRASTQYELNQLAQLERERQLVNEERKRQLDAAKDAQRRVNTMNDQLWKTLTELEKVIGYTLSVNDRIDWDSEMMLEDYPPFEFNEQPPQDYKKHKVGFIRSLFINDKTFELPDLETPEMKDYEERRNKAITDYLKRKAAYDTEKNKKNGEMLYLKSRFEASDTDAIERYISIVLTKSEYPGDFEHDFEVTYNKTNKTVVINYLFQDIDSFPLVEKYVLNSETNTIDEVAMSKTKSLAFYSEFLYSVGVRTIHEVFESVYTDAVDEVCFNGYIEGTDGFQCAFAMRTSRQNFEAIDLKSPLANIISDIDLRTIKDFSGYEQITPFE